MHPWRATRYRTNRTHQKAYRRLVEPSVPEEDHDDRNALYGVYVTPFHFFRRTFDSNLSELTIWRRFNDLTVSSNWSANKQTREL